MTGGVPDLRLAGFAVATWLSSLAALYLSARSGILLGAAALLGAALTVAAASRRGRASVFRAPTRTTGRADPVSRSAVAGARSAASASLSRGPAPVVPARRSAAVAVRWIGLTVLLGVGCGAIVTGARVMARESGPLVALVRAGEPVRIEAVVRDDPRALRGSPARPPTYLVAIDLRAVGAEEAAPLRLEARALVLGSDLGWRGLLPGQRIAARGKLMPPRGGDLRAAVVSVKEAPELIGRPSWAQRAAGVLRAGLQRACEPLPDDSGGLLPGLVVGDTSRLDEALSDDFRTTGMTHLMAVSGANVAIILGVVLFAVRRTRAGPAVQAVVCAVVLVGFVILARPSPSVVRAAAMGAIGLVGLASGRPRAALPALAAGVAALILYDPELAADPGFALSVLATSGLLLLAPVWRDALRRRGWPAGAAEALAVPAAAQVACGPVVAGLSGTVSLIAVPANLVVVPAIAPATLLGVGAAVLSPVWADGAAFAAWLGHWPAKWLVLVATYGARVPSGALPWPDGVWGALLLGAITVAVLFATPRPVLRRLAVVMTLAGMLGAMPVRLLASGWPPANWIVVTCAVGQGDAVVLPAGPSRAVVIDAGPEADPVDHCLRRLGVRQVVLFVVSHFHVDHIGGVAGVFRGRRVGAVAGPDWPEPPGGRASVVAAARPVPLHAIGPGWSYEVGGLRLTVIGPFEPLHGTNSDPNNNSLVLRAELNGETVLLPGDAETEEQDELLQHLGPELLRADVLKVSHHGSAYQSPAFVDAVDPAVALVSVGKDNDYGHPNAALLARLARGGARVLRTDESGDLAAVAAGDGLAVVARGDPPDG
ncbi:ComEC/Rec2 family competence protein [Paractinoplanes toevensis]|uniref:Competence protein ComEC n=1 Tax=Paractinoplanes toevensis TaxID=571911 RepID=A0A919T5J6_9ACTN|nr:ComEC/Rec2 family competence protein [Actinoplanes toevensis]GIM89077.1 competence protein ComEC [Actinoplanes toevensis]